MRLFQAAARRATAVGRRLGAVVAAAAAPVAASVVAVTAAAACTGPGSPPARTSVTAPPPRTSASVPTNAAAAPALPTGASGAVVVEPPLHAVASVGPLFPSGVSSAHTCTAAVVSSPTHDVVVTAAHCVSGTGAGAVFVPGYDEGRMPYGSWQVRAAYVASGWLNGRDPHADYAFLAVSPSAANASSQPVESVVGGSTLSHSAAPGQVVTVAGYVAGRDDDPVVCSGAVYLTSAFPTIDCPGYASGTSGSPWLADYDAAHGVGVITGVIGGLNQGGCTDGTSYTAPFDASSDALLARASAGGAADSVPGAGPDGC